MIVNGKMRIELSVFQSSYHAPRKDVQIFDGFDFSDCSFLDLNLTGYSFVNCNLARCNFMNANLTGVDLSRADLADANMRGS